MAPSNPASDRPDADGLPTRGELLDGRFRIRELLGIGGMGAVYAADDSERGQPVALKILLPREAEHEDSVKRFTREAQAARVIDDAHVARVYEAGTLQSGLPYISMELLEGVSLDRFGRKHAPLPIEQAVDYVLQACEGVAAAHARGIIHRDLKPGNLHVTKTPDGREIVKVLDFGIAKATSAFAAGGLSLSLTETSATLGSPQYMSPEQLRSAKTVDARADVWSLGLILHQLLTGRAAFDGDSVGAVFAKVLADPPTPLRVHRPDAPVELERVILGCLERNVLCRHQDVAQLADALLPFAPPHARQLPQRIRQILEAAGAASPYPPIRPSQARAAGQPELGPESWPQGPGSWPAGSGSWPRGPASWPQGPGSWPGAAGSPGPAEAPATELTNTDATRRWEGPSASGTGRSWGAVAARAPQSRVGPLHWIIAAGAFVAVAALGAIGLWLLGGDPGESSAKPVAAAGSRSSSVVSPPTAGAGASAGQGGQGPDGDTALVSVRLAVEPAGATVELDGIVRRDNPLRIPRSAEPHELRITAAGYVPAERRIEPTGDLELEIVLRPVRPTGQPGARSSATAKATATAKGPMVDKL